MALEDAAEGGCEVGELLRDGLPGGDGDLSVDEAGLVPGDGREEEGEVLGHDAIGQPGRQRGHDPESEGGEGSSIPVYSTWLGTSWTWAELTWISNFCQL